MAPWDDSTYPDALRAALVRLDFVCQDGLQVIGGRREHGFAGSGVVEGEPVIVRFARSSPISSAAGDRWSAVLVESPVGLDLGLALEPKGFVRAPNHISVDNEACNAEYDIGGDDQAQVRALFDPEVCHALHALGSLGGHVRLADRQVEVQQSWGFLELMPTLSRVASVARELKRSAAAVPPPAELASAVESWRTYAESNDLTFSKRPLRLSGHGVTAQPMRLSRTKYESRLSVALRQPLAAGLSLRPAGALTPFIELIAGRDVQLDDAAFDRAFKIEAEKPELVPPALTEHVRRLLLDLLPWGVVAFTDSGVTLLTTRHDEVPTAIDRMRTIARAVDDNHRRSAYR